MAHDSPHRLVHLRPFGNDRFGIIAERLARFCGTPGFIVGQTLLVVLWIAANSLAFSFRWDPYPFILLNLAFSTQAAYAAPLILLAATRQADRDKLRDNGLQDHREAEVHRELHRTKSARRRPRARRSRSAPARLIRSVRKAAPYPRPGLRTRAP